MPLSRDELQRRLTQLEADMPRLIAEHPDAGDFNQAFAEQADAVVEGTTSEDDTWAFEQIDAILARHGLWQPAEDDLPPDG